MKRFNHGIKWTLAAVLLAGVTAAPVMAEKTTPATGKNTAVPAVPRAIPDLIPYHKFDPPKSKLFDMSKLTISGDIRVRPELRTNSQFGIKPDNRSFVQQWTRLGFNYSISPDVTFFFQGQHSKTWGAGDGPADANASNGTFYGRQAFMLVRNFLVPNLTVKAGRQMVVWGNHRMFGHFDWNNVGWSHDGLTANYKLSKTANLQVGWLRTDETNCTNPSAGGCAGGATTADTDADIVYVRAPMKVAGIVLEPTYIWHSGGTGPSIGAPRPPDQSRHTLGGRAVKKFAAGSTLVDVTVEGYYQFGEIGFAGTPGTSAGFEFNPDGLDCETTPANCISPVAAIDGTPGSGGRTIDIEAYAFHIDGGITLPVPMQPRLSAEYNTASGNKADGKKWGNFDQLYPTNHIHFGYMDNQSWKNMNHLAFGLQLRPSKDSHFEVTGHLFSLMEAGDNWYGASQKAQSFANGNGATSDQIGEEIDVVYTHFFTPGNHVAWQLGAGVFLPGTRLDQAAGGNAVEQTWGYTQLWVNF